MENAETILEKFLAERGMRYTRERKLILHEVMSLHDHFEAEDILLSLRAKGEKVSAASVYRTIPLLIESGIVAKNPCDKMERRLEHVLGHKHHDHLICLKCGKVVEFRKAVLERLQEDVAKEHGFEASDHRMVISGICSDCRKAEKRA